MTGVNRQNTLPSLGMGRLVFLGLLAVFLSFFGPLLVFAPVPLAMAILLYGRTKAALTVAGITLAILSLSWGQSGASSAYFVCVYVLAYLFSVLVGEIVLQKKNPLPGMFSAGVLLLGGIVMLLGIYSLISERGLRGELQHFIMEQFAAFKSESGEFLKAGGEDARALSDILSSPEKAVGEIIRWSPSLLVSVVFGGLWVCLGVVLKNAYLWKDRLAYPWNSSHFLAFTMPFSSVWFLIAGMVCYLMGDYVHGDLRVVGGNLLFCMGVFYFFQGFGILIDFLIYAKINGIWRTMFIITAVVIGMRFIVLLGVFDMWFNFRRFFKKDSSKGEQV